MFLKVWYKWILLSLALRYHSRKQIPHNFATRRHTNKCTINVGSLYIHVCLKIQSCQNMSFFTSFDITWYAEAAMYAKIFFSLILFFFFHRGNDRVKLTKCDKIEWGKKCKWHTFWIAILLKWHTVYFIVILFHIKGKWIPMRNLATILPLKFKLSGKFQRFNTVDGSTEMLKNSWISKNFNQNEKL